MIEKENEFAFISLNKEANIPTSIEETFNNAPKPYEARTSARNHSAEKVKFRALNDALLFAEAYQLKVPMISLSKKLFLQFNKNIEKIVTFVNSELEAEEGYLIARKLEELKLLIDENHLKINKAIIPVNDFIRMIENPQEFPPEKTDYAANLALSIKNTLR